jgi:hypothetical protein
METTMAKRSLRGMHRDAGTAHAAAMMNGRSERFYTDDGRVAEIDEEGLVLVLSDHLFASEDGRVECEQHAPGRLSDTWRRGRYRRMSYDEQSALRAEIADIVRPDEPLCEGCRSIARRAKAEGGR